MVMTNEKVVLTRLLTEVIARVNGKKHIDTVIWNAAWAGTTKEKVLYKCLSSKA